MKIRYLSDLHLEGFNSKTIEKLENRFIPKYPEDAESILVLAGDISSNFFQLFKFLKQIESRFKKVIYIPGNHEYYRQHYTDWNIAFNNKAKEELSNTLWAVDEVKKVEIADTTFIFGTMWADGGKSKEEEFNVQFGLNDFRLILFEGRCFTVKDMQDINQKQLNQIDDFLIESNFTCQERKPIVVITHHLPSYSLCHPRFGSSINGGFACDAEHVIFLADYWIHGHTHDTIDTCIHGCKVLSNPAGYSSETSKSKYNTFGYKLLEF